MKKNILGPVIAAFTFFFLYSSCTKIDTTDLGNDLIPTVDNVNTFETVLDIETDNLSPNDTTQMPFNLNHAVGIIENDPDFGKTEAALYFDVSPSAFKSYPFVNKDSIVAVDSVVVSLAYKSLYGDSQSIQNFEVFEVDQAAGFRYLPASDYKLNDPDFLIIPTALGSRSIDFRILNDSLTYINGKDTVRTSNELRIHVNKSIANRFITADTTNAYQNDSIFKTYLKGLAVKASNASPSKNALAYFDINDSKTRITFYCRVKNKGQDSAIAPFFRFLNYVNSNRTTTSSLGAHANLIKRTPSNGYLANITNSNLNDATLYIQSAPGSYATLKIPGIDTLTNRVVHRAEIVVEKLTPVSETFAVPDLLFIGLINNSNDTALTIPNDFVLTGFTPGGVLDVGTYDVNLLGGRLKDNKYVFNISRHIQNIVTNKKPNYTFRIYAPLTTSLYILQPTGSKSSKPVFFTVNPSVAKGRVIVAGGSHPTKKMRLRIIYSKI